MRRYQSGQLGLTVNQLALPSVVRIRLCAHDKGKEVPGCGHWFSSWICGSSSVDRALAFQAEGRGFESRLPLLGQSLRGCGYGNKCRFSSVVERILGKDEVPSSTLGSGSYAKCEGVDETALLRWSP